MREQSSDVGPLPHRAAVAVNVALLGLALGCSEGAENHLEPTQAAITSVAPTTSTPTTAPLVTTDAPTASTVPDVDPVQAPQLAEGDIQGLEHGWSVEVASATALDGRLDPVGVWTGDEVIWWGGTTGGDERRLPLAGGVGFDLKTRSWRQLAPAPLEPSVDSPAVWTGDELIVGAGTEAAAYAPDEDRWESLPSPGFEILALGWNGESLMASDGVSAAQMSLADAEWGAIEAPPVADGETVKLHFVAGAWVAVITDPRPSFKPLHSAVYAPEADRWTERARLGVYSIPQVASTSSTIIAAGIGGGESGLAIFDPVAVDVVARFDSTPVARCEGAEGAATVGDRILVLDRCGAPDAFELVDGLWRRITAKVFLRANALSVDADGVLVTYWPHSNDGQGHIELLRPPS